MKRFALITVTIIPILGFVSAQCGPSGAHIKTGDESCTCSGTTVNCDKFQLCGVGNRNANVLLTGSYSATVDCRNNGGQVVPVKAQGVTSSSSTGSLQPRNGCLTVPKLSTTTPTASQFEKQATCPNGNWTPVLRPGTTSLDSYTYTLTFAGCSSPYDPLTLTGSCPA
ncbi:hypothetical protein ACKLNR_014287 [Fusarium oxysporum f. sp. zingiberi]